MNCFSLVFAWPTVFASPPLPPPCHHSYSITMAPPHPKFFLQVDCKFIALRCGPLLVACDQHAADERVRLESITAAVCAARGRRWGCDRHCGGGSGSGSGGQVGNGGGESGGTTGGRSWSGGAGRDSVSLVWPDCAALSSFRLAQPQVRWCLWDPECLLPPSQGHSDAVPSTYLEPKC